MSSLYRMLSGTRINSSPNSAATHHRFSDITQTPTIHSCTRLHQQKKSARTQPKPPRFPSSPPRLIRRLSFLRSTMAPLHRAYCGQCSPRQHHLLPPPRYRAPRISTANVPTHLSSETASLRRLRLHTEKLSRPLRHGKVGLSPTSTMYTSRLSNGSMWTACPSTWSGILHFPAGCQHRVEFLRSYFFFVSF
jgi:hypothetical protein